MADIFEVIHALSESVSGVMKEENPRIAQMREELEMKRKKREESEKIENSK